ETTHRLLPPPHRWPRQRRAWLRLRRTRPHRRRLWRRRQGHTPSSAPPSPESCETNSWLRVLPSPPPRTTHLAHRRFAPADDFAHVLDMPAKPTTSPA